MSGWLSNWHNITIRCLPFPAPGQTGRPGKEDLRVDSRPLVFRVLAVAALLLALAPAGLRAAALQGPSIPSPRTPTGAPAEVPPPPEGMSFTTHLDHTAVWVGDQFHYTIIVYHSADFEFVLDTLTKETVNMDPLQVVDVT